MIKLLACAGIAVEGHMTYVVNSIYYITNSETGYSNCVISAETDAQ